MICPPYRLSRPDRYCRLLPPFQHSGDASDVRRRLRDLAKSMYERHAEKAFQLETAADAMNENAGRIAAAYTYFGQFIMHDLTFDDTPFRSAGLQEPEETINYRNPKLDLDSVYGEGPFSRTHGYLYDGIRFRLGSALNPYDAPFDVPLVECFPAVVDERNCENDILRQIHAIFLLLHNVVVNNLEDSARDKEDKEPSRLFEAARARVRWTFQWLVRHDFLAKICDSDVWEAVVIHGQRLIHWPTGHFSIPVEFSHAAARFGHSMVRSGYILRKHPKTETASLPELFGSTRRGGSLEGGKAIEWARFTNQFKEFAGDINTMLIDQFAQVPDELIHPFVAAPRPHEPHMLGVRTLCRAAAMRLPTGQQLRVALQPRATINASEAARKLLRKLRFEHETPLWYYVLLEAESVGQLHLGPIGSRILLEVIEGALLHDPDSFFFQENLDWQRDVLKSSAGPTPIKEFSQLASLVGLERKQQ